MSEPNMMPPSGPVYPYEHLEAMYPDIYRRVYPVMLQVCEMYDVPSNPGFYPYPTRAAVEQLTDYICQRCAAEPGFAMDRQVNPLLRSLILILLIRQLLRRRFTFYY